MRQRPRADVLLLLGVAGPGCSLHVHESTQYVSLKLQVVSTSIYSELAATHANKEK